MVADKDAEKFEVAPQALALNESFTAIALAFANVPAVLSTYHTSQNLIQAIPPGASPLLQLPHLTPAIAAAIEGPTSTTNLTIQEFMAMPEYKRRKRASDQPNTLDPRQYNAAVSVARQLPLLKVEKAFFKVMGERHITPSSLVQFVIKARVIPPGTAKIPEVNELDLEDVDPDEGDLDALHGRKSKKANKAKQLESGSDSSGGPTSTDDVEKPLQPPLAFAPYFARDHSPRWHVFLSDSKLGKIAVPPFALTTFNKPLFTPQGEPTFNMQTFKMQFQAPPQASKYPFVAHIICDSYIGMDSTVDVVLDVEDAAKAEAVESEDDISEPDEGT
jgi:translocation protein SEC63